MSDKDTKAQGSIEDALMQQLRFGGIDKENLKEMVGIVAGVQKGGLREVKVFPKGTIAPASFLTDILLKPPRLGGVVLFPYGTPWPEIFKVNIDIGNPVEAGPINA